VIVLVGEGIRRSQWEAPARSVLFEAIGTAEWFRDNDKGDVRIKLHEHRVIFIYPAYATGWGTLTDALHPGARVKLLHEPPLWPHKEFSDGLATYEIEVNEATVIPYKFAARNWTIGMRIELVVIVAMAAGRPAEAVERLMPVRSRSYRIGGSHAQRELVQLTVIGAALAARNGRLARALAAERTEQKPASPHNWRLTARALEAQGATVEARLASEHAELRRRAQIRRHAA
jgi:hypothetical protein